MSQLDDIMRGKGMRVMRRLTSRSKFRASQALTFIGNNSNLHHDSKNKNINNVLNDTKVNNNYVVSTDVEYYRKYLYCLSELQEIRLSSSEETLRYALNLKLENQMLCPLVSSFLPSFVSPTLSFSSQNSEADIDDNCSSSNNNGIKSNANPHSLVRTWIHDEGVHEEVVELSRDVLIIAEHYEESIWFLLYDHMIEKKQYRAILQTTLMIMNKHIFRELFFGSLGVEVLKIILKIVYESIEKSEKVFFFN